MEGVALPQLHDDIERDGFHVFDWDGDGSIESLALSLGRPVPSAPNRRHIDVLVPKSREDSPPGTLSFTHGVEPFPFHTETAHWRQPVDWVILKCVNPGAGNRPTLLLDGWELAFEERDLTHLRQSLMVVKSGSKSFLAPLVTRDLGRLSFRHDPGCMKPASKYDRVAVDIFVGALINAARVSIEWKPGRCVVFDNRRMLHSRPKSSTADPDRQLERIYIVR